MKAIINRGKEFGTINGVITKNSEIQKLITSNLKSGNAVKLIDTDSTLMYLIKK